MSMEATIFYDSYLPAALQRALDYAGDDGFVASMPALLHARANAPYDNIIWNSWFNPNTEENVATRPGAECQVSLNASAVLLAGCEEA